MSGEDKGDAALTVAKRAGLLVIAIGIVDLVLGVVSSPDGNVKFRIGGLLVGLLMLFGGLRILAIVRWLALLALGSLVLGLFSVFAFVPADLTLTQMRLHPLVYALDCLSLLLSVAVALVAALRLGHPQLLAARAAAGLSFHSVRIPLVLGVLVAVGAGIVQYRVLNGENGQRASRMAAERLGPGYKYFTNYVGTSYGKETVVSATVEAWNEKEVLLVPVQWRE